MELLLRQKVLIAIYYEQNKDKPRMNKVLRGINFGVRQSELIQCLIHLNQNERYTSEKLGPMIRLTREGREYVEELCDIHKSDRPIDKNKKLIETIKEHGLSFLVDVTAKVVLGVVDKQIGL
jgi:hypothetical protein